MNYCQLVSAQIRVFCLICFAAGLTFTESRAAVSVSMCSTVFALTAHFTIPLMLHLLQCEVHAGHFCIRVVLSFLGPWLGPPQAQHLPL